MSHKASVSDLEKAIDNMAKRSLLQRHINESDYDFKIRVLAKLFEDSSNGREEIINYNTIWNDLNKKKAT